MYAVCKEMVENQKRCLLEHKAKYGKKIYEELLPIAWHPDRAYIGNGDSRRMTLKRLEY